MKGWRPDDDTYDHGLSFDEWKRLGFFVIGGSKCECRDPSGDPLFLPSQVRPRGWDEATKTSTLYRWDSISGELVPRRLWST